MTGKRKPRYAIDIPAELWTPIQNEVFSELFGSLKQKRSAALYLYLYDRVFHRTTLCTAITVARLARLNGMDSRTAQKCISELQRKGLIQRVRKGVKRSRIRTDAWEVPLAFTDLREGGWTPISRILLRKYIPRYPNAVLLPLLIFYQHMHRKNFSWAGTATLSKRLNWGQSRVRAAVREMCDEKKWPSKYPDLPVPLRSEHFMKAGQRRRHLTVTAVYYAENSSSGKSGTMQLSSAFRAAFHLDYH